MINSTTTNSSGGGGSSQPLNSSTPTKVAKIKSKEKKRRKKKKRPPHKSKMITGYIIYASEIRKDIIKKYPDRDFGHISKLVGIEWKNLPPETKVAYEKRAQEQNVKSKAIAAEALELKKLADAAEEKAKEDSLNQSATSQQQLPTQCNGSMTNGHGQPTIINYNNQQQQIGSSALIMSPQNPMEQTMQQYNGCQQHQQSSPKFKQNDAGQQQQPLQIIQQRQQHQQTATTVQYCGSNNNNCGAQPNQLQQSFDTSQSPPQQTQYQRNNIVYRKPTTVRLRPKDVTTQTDAIKWIANKPKKPLRFSQKFIDYLNSNNPSIV